RNLGDHAADVRRIGTFDDAPDPVQSEPDQRLALAVMAADRTPDLLNPDHLVVVVHLSIRLGFSSIQARAAGTHPPRSLAPPHPTRSPLPLRRLRGGAPVRRKP